MRYLGLECVLECWKTQKGEDSVVGEKNGNKWHFLAPKWRSKVTGREIGGRGSYTWSAVAGSGPMCPHVSVLGRCLKREMTHVAARR